MGVKNGVNAFGKKNYLGTFVPPFAVINDDGRSWARSRTATGGPACRRPSRRPSSRMGRFSGTSSSCDPRCWRATPRPWSTSCTAAPCCTCRTSRLAATPSNRARRGRFDLGHWCAHKLE